MADINYTASNPKKQYTRRIGDNGFLGADYSTAPIFASDRRFRDLKNVWKDYKSGSGVAIETVPGIRKLCSDSSGTDRVNGMYRFAVFDDRYGKFEYWVFFHYGTNLYCAPEEDDGNQYYVSDGDNGLRQYDQLPNAPSLAVPFGDKLIIFCASTNGGEIPAKQYLLRKASSDDIYEDLDLPTGTKFVVYSATSSSPAAPDFDNYVPTTYIDGLPYEQKNMLTARSKEIFHATTIQGTRYDTITSDPSYYYYLRCVLHEKVKATTSSPYTGNIVSFKIDGTSQTPYPIVSNGYITELRFDYTGSSHQNEDHTVEVEYVADPTKFVSYQSYEDYKDRNTFNEGNPGYAGTAYDAIAGCTICASFDERIFLAGNPKLPNTVFYSHRDLTGYNNPTYFGVLNYNNLGTSNAPITAMIPSANALYVLKDDSATDPTMYVLTGQTTDIDLLPRIYTVESGLPGIGCKGAACNFLDDIVFMSRNGVIGIDKQAVNLERTLGDRSALINGKLLQEDVTQAVFAEAEGYLWCLFKNNGHVYLADSRAYTQGAGYEWYFIDSVGSWENDADKWEFVNEYLQNHDDTVYDFHGAGGYQYATRALFELKAPSLDGYEVRYQPDGSVWLMAKSGATSYKIVPYPTEHEAYTGNGQITVYLDYTGIEGEYDDRRDRTDMTYSKDTSGAFVCLVETSAGSGEYYQVKPTGEKISVEGTTVFHPATCMVASNDRIFFGTDNGDLLTFNNDKRGVQSESEIAVRAEDNPIDGIDIYEQNRFPFMLRPEWYSFCGHRIESFVETSDDDGGIGNLTKDTVRRSCVVDMKAMLGSKYKITTYTDRDGWKNDNAATGSMNDASQTMLDAVNFSGDEHINVQIRERARKWVHKRYRIESNGFRSPFGLYRITYNFEINGRIK